MPVESRLMSVFCMIRKAKTSDSQFDSCSLSLVGANAAGKVKMHTST